MRILKPVEKKASNKNDIKRLLFVALSLLIEILIAIVLFSKLKGLAEWISAFSRVIAAIFVLGIYAEHKTSSMKMPWIILILAAPIFGVALFLFVGLEGSTKKMAKRFSDIDNILLPKLTEKNEIVASMENLNKSVASVSDYIYNYGGYPMYRNTDLVYYSDASEGIDAQIEAISKAEKFVFMEYHAIEDSVAWKRLEDALVERVNNGVEVRVFYDDIGSLVFINKEFKKKLESYGIKCRVFNPVTAVFNLFLNNRDHRKITVIDGKVAFTGGYNLADEYFNITHPYDAWKDTGIRIEGDAVKSFTVMFLEMWNAINKKDEDDTDFTRYITDYEYHSKDKGFVQPYADSPIDDEHVGEEVYISMINKANDYCYFITPYLIITDEMSHALSLAAKRGVDVRIITPGIPDKKMIYSVTRSFYNGLARNGVSIFEWTPGFCHAKMCLVDGIMATVGTINLDYRSLYHHFENGCFMYNCEAIKDIKADFDKTFTESRDVTEKYRSHRSNYLRLGQLILRLFAELL